MLQDHIFHFLLYDQYRIQKKFWDIVFSWSLVIFLNNSKILLSYIVLHTFSHSFLVV